MLTTTRGRATVAGLDSSQEYALQVLMLNGTTEKLLAKRRFTSKKHSEALEGFAVKRGGSGRREVNEPHHCLCNHRLGFLRHGW